MAHNIRGRVIASLLAAALTACSANGMHTLPAQQPQTSPGKASVHFKILVPSSNAKTSVRRPAYVSPSTAFVIVSDSGPGTKALTSFDCTGTPVVCSGDVLAPIGSNTFAVTLEDSSHNELSTGTTTVTIVANTANNVSLTFNPVVSTIQMPFPSTAPGTAATVPFVPNALDADGNTIIGPGTYQDVHGNAITVTASLRAATSGVSLKKATSTGPNDPMEITYDGSHHQRAIIDGTATNYANPIPNGSFVSVGAVQTYSYNGDGIPVMTEGPDHTLWLAIPGATAGIGFSVIHVLADGSQTQYDFPPPFSDFPNGGGSPTGITSGPDGNLWVAIGLPEAAAIRVTPAGAETVFQSKKTVTQLANLSVGPDGNFWAGTGQNGNIARITPAGAITAFPITGSGGTPRQSTFGNDGKLYYVGGGLYKFDPATQVGVLITLPNFLTPTSVTTGDDGKVWFTGTNTSYGFIGTVTTSGTVTTALLPNTIPMGISNSGDGSAWVVDSRFGARFIDWASGEVGGYAVPISQYGGVLAMHEVNGSLWFATYDGVQTYLVNAQY